MVLNGSGSKIQYDLSSWKVGLMVIQVLEWSGSGVEKREC
jgi:hypothetical protein